MNENFSRCAQEEWVRCTGVRAEESWKVAFSAGRHGDDGSCGHVLRGLSPGGIAEGCRWVGYILICKKKSGMLWS